MPNSAFILDLATETIRIEHQAIEKLIPQLDNDFAEAVQKIHASKGRLIISGIGKSAIIAQKIVATLNSTGTPSIFLHAADAIHGDLGMMTTDDIALLISKSGESAEIKVLVPFIKKMGNTLMALCGNRTSFLAQAADYCISCYVDKEACPNNLAPTSSTTAQLVMGDALAVCLLKLKGFTPNDFAKFHPGGALGKQLYLTIEDLSKQHEAPAVHAESAIKEIILEITGKRLGATAVIDENNLVKGIITDGDIRRMLTADQINLSVLANDIMNHQPKTIEAHELAINGLMLMRKHQISQLIVLKDEKYAGIIHIHDLIREGIV